MKKRMSMFLALLLGFMLIVTACQGPEKKSEKTEAPVKTETEKTTVAESTPATSEQTKQASTQTSEPSSSQSETTKGTEAGNTRTIVDHNGQKVVLPAQIDRIVIAGLTPLPSVYCMLMGSTDKLVGIDPHAKNAAMNSILIRAMPGLADLPTDFLQDDNINAEELLKLKPDVVFTHGNWPELHEACVAAGVPSVQFSTTLFEKEDYNTIKTVNAWIEQIGEVLGIENKAKEMIAEGEALEATIRERAKSIKPEDQVKVLMLTNYRDNTITASGQSFSKFWCNTVGGKYLTDDVPGFTAEIDMERVYALNPDAIYLSSFSPYTPEDFYNNTAGEGHDWSSVKAVQDKRVYKFPLGTYYWYPPSSDAALCLLWMATTMYPEVYSDLNLDQQIKDHYLKYYGITVSDEDLQNIYYPSEESAAKW